MQKEPAKYLTFRLGEDTFAIALPRVREIMGIQRFSGMPQSAAYVRGVINLRGQEVPVVDLRLRLGLPEREFTRRTCIIVLDNPHIGIIVDRVTDVLPSLAPGKTKFKILSDLDALL